MTEVNLTLYKKTGSGADELNPKSIASQIKMNDAGGTESTVQAEIETLRASIPTVQLVTTTDAAVRTYAVTASFTTLTVFLDGFICEPTAVYTVSGQNVTFVNDLPVGSKITFISW